METNPRNPYKTPKVSLSLVPYQSDRYLLIRHSIINISTHHQGTMCSLASVLDLLTAWGIGMPMMIYVKLNLGLVKVHRSNYLVILCMNSKISISPIEPEELILYHVPS
jgi:hypothetical protein